MPAWEFGHNRMCWKNGGRTNCKKNDEEYQKMEYDLHNLVPAIGEINADRSNRKFGMIAGETRKYGSCDFEVSFEQNIVEPGPEIRGDIARIYFYMCKMYNISISDAAMSQFIAWDAADPVDMNECKRDRKIAHIQGNHNQFVLNQCDHLN